MNMEIFMSSLQGRDQSQKLNKKLENLRKMKKDHGILYVQEVRQDFTKVRCRNNFLNNKFSLVYSNPQVRNEIKPLYNGNILFPLHQHESPSSDRNLSLKGS